MALQERHGRYFWVPHYPVKTVTLCRDPTGSTRYLTYESVGSLYISYTLLIVNNSGQGSKIHTFVQMALQGRYRRHVWVPYDPVAGVTMTVKYKIGNKYLTKSLLGTFKSHRHTLDYPERSSGGEDMRSSPNDATRAVRVTILSPTLPRRDCHNGSKLSHGMPIIERRV